MSFPATIDYRAIRGAVRFPADLAQMLNTNLVVVRRTLGALRDHGIVESESGHGGGWKMSKTLDDITILDIQRALHKGAVLLAGVSHDHPSCPVERASNAVLKSAHAAAEAKLLEIYATTTLSEIARIALASPGEQAND